MVIHNGYKLAEDLIPEFERCVEEAQSQWFLMENVPQAPTPKIAGYQICSFVLNNRWLGETQNRVRRISFGTKTGEIDLRHFIELAALEPSEYHYAVTSQSREVPVKMLAGKKPKNRRCDLHYGPRLTIEEMAKRQGLPKDFLAEAPFTVAAKREVIANGVPLAMARALAKAVVSALSQNAVKIAV